jgi:hypothetical protein
MIVKMSNARTARPMIGMVQRPPTHNVFPERIATQNNRPSAVAEAGSEADLPSGAKE